VITTALSAPAHTVDLCHIANAGFLIKGENASVLVDGLMVEDHYSGRFALPSDVTIESMMQRTDDFSALKLVLSTHRHGDHFDPKATIRHLRANTHIQYVYPADTIATLTANGLTPDEEHRITAVPVGSPQSYMFDDISVESFAIDHGENMPQNVGYRITLDGRSIFFTGDISASRDSLKASGLTAMQTDVLVIPYWYGMNDAKQRTAMRESWSYKTIIPTHFQTGAPWMARYGGPDGLKATVRDSMPNAMILANENQCYTLPAK
jgi:L-ascorbate metabolism protein UlaG (beta-lactamase superfamily)